MDITRRRGQLFLCGARASILLCRTLGLAQEMLNEAVPLKRKTTYRSINDLEILVVKWGEGSEWLNYHRVRLFDGQSDVCLVRL